MELGIYTFAEPPIDPETGRQVGAETRIRELLEEIELADRVGLDVFGVGEHHRPDYAVSSPAIVLAAAAAKTERIRLTSAVSVLSSDDPVRVFQDFALIDPCGMAGLDVTSVARELGWDGPAAEPSTERVQEAGVWFADRFRSRLDAAVVESQAQDERARRAAGAGV